MPLRALLISIILFLLHLQMLAEPALSTSGSKATPQVNSKDPSPDDIKALYEKADSFFILTHPTSTTDSQALSLFGTVITESEVVRSHGTEDILFQSYIKKGVLLDIKGNYTEALDAYHGALRCKGRHPDWSDSLLFKVYIYAGPDHYQLDNFDSAYSMLNKAALLAEKYPGLTERDRLYNALGALYYESGNYLQGKNYFSKALEIIRKERPNDRVSIINFENNIASCLYKLGDYRESLKIYSHLLLFGQSSSQLYLNMGKSYVGLLDYSGALALYKKVKPDEVPGVYNEMAYAEFLKNEPDSALIFLNRWKTKVIPAKQTKIDGGINDLYRAQVLMAKRENMSAIAFLQQAIITFSGTFKNEDIHANPTNFAGSFASYRLFDALSCKAGILETIYSQNGNEEYLKAALDAYSSAIILFRYIEKTYTTDDAKLFLKKNNRDLYESAVLICLELDRLHPHGPYLEEAFITEEKSKASIVSGRLDEMALLKIPGIDPKLVQRQRDIKYNIARLELKGDPELGSQITQAVAKQKADDEIELSFLQKNIELNNAYYKMKFEDSCPTVAELQGGLGPRQAILSFFLSRSGLNVFTITSNSFHYLFIDSLPQLSAQVKDWTSILNNTQRGKRFGNQALEAQLSRRLVRPMLAALHGKDEWTIIPDGIFYLLPFESLPLDTNGHYLIEKTTISYQLSAKFLAEPFNSRGKKFDSYSVLSFAPFAGKPEWVDAHPLRYMDQLPGSGPEIADLPGKQYINGEATKAHFLAELNHYPVIHLATHAISDPQNSQGSLICFYPQNPGNNPDKGPQNVQAADEDGDCLFLPELYGLNMDSTDLVILSACESGKGEIVDNEGMISLSRGFMYAGCASTVNSLWKADDKSTAEILHKFHVYLENGYTKSAALRQAKLDYMHSNSLYITPDYWAHLILIGNTDAVVEKKTTNKEGPNWLFIILGAGLIGAFFIWLVRSAYPERSFP